MNCCEWNATGSSLIRPAQFLEREVMRQKFTDTALNVSNNGLVRKM